MKQDFENRNLTELAAGDIYFQPEWGTVNRCIEAGEPQIFVLENEHGKIINSHILRKIPKLIDGVQYYDITTPYGYGGPLMTQCRDEADRQTLLQQYSVEFEKYCAAHRIVSEFIRFHPVFNNAHDFQSVYEVQRLRSTVGTDLRSDNPVEAEFSRSCRKSIRRAMDAGVSWRVIEHPTQIDDFLKVYYATMDRDHADTFYYFPKDYFLNCLNLFGDHILMVQALFQGQVIAAGFYITSGDMIHAHLSGTLREFLHLSPAYVLKYAAVVWGKEHGYRLIHYGGGTSNSEDNSLYQFKRKFTQNTLFDFCIGKKIWNAPVYEALCRDCEKTDFFPAYRHR